MKKTIFLLVVSIVFAGCASQNKTVDKTTSAANKAGNSAAKPANDSNGAANSVSTAQNQTAQKVENPTEISFEPGALPADWRWIDPDSKFNPTKYDTKSGALHIDVPTGKDLYGETRTAPQLLKAISGDFEIETRVKFDPKDNYQGAGLIVFRNDSNYIRLERGYGGVGGGESGIRLDMREDEAYEPIATPEKFPTSAKEVELKIRRAGREFTAFWRLPDGDWKEVGKYRSSYPETVQVGLIACNTAEEIPVEFSYIKLSPVAK
jgi:regulation of enolase protein 1 (concanavalin A-like superfamily)/outer membrane murein-binding lipoprotein Lpp